METRRALSPGEDDAHPDSSTAGISPPADLEVHRFMLGSDEYLAISFPLPSTRSESEPAVSLTPSEREILGLLVEGRSNADIAHLRGKSPRTIANQVASIFRKLGVGSRRELRSRHTPTRPIA